MKIVSEKKMTLEEKKDYINRLKKERHKILVPVYTWSVITIALAIGAITLGSFWLVGGVGISSLKIVDRFAEKKSGLREIDKKIEEYKEQGGR